MDDNVITEYINRFWDSRLKRNGMSEWISSSERDPSDSDECVFITDGKYIILAQFIDNSKEYYGVDLLDWDDDLQQEVPIPIELHDPHWIFINRSWGCYDKNGHEGPAVNFDIDNITHWMPLPKPPETI